MIKTEKRTEREYRALMLDSSSSLKMFVEDRKKYFKRYILNEESEEEEDDKYYNKSMLMGMLVESMLPGVEEDFDSKFYSSECIKPPTGKALDFVNALYRRTVECMEDGVITKDFVDLARLAYDDADCKKPVFANYVKEFVGSEAEMYYKELRESRPRNLYVVCASEKENADRIRDELCTNPITASIINQRDDVRYKVLNQYQIEYEADGMEMKSMLDKVLIDRIEKKIWIYDVKVTWNVENFYEDYYLKRKTYIQAYLYYVAMNKAKFDVEGEDFGEYEVQPPIFIVADNINYMQPLLYITDQNDLEDAVKGFEHKGREYVGVEEILKDLKWALENSEWRISRKNALLRGKVKLKKPSYGTDDNVQ